MEENRYEYRAVKGLALSSLFRAIVGLLIGILISLQLVYTQFNLTSRFTYGRLRPVHTMRLSTVYHTGYLIHPERQASSTISNGQSTG